MLHYSLEWKHEGPMFFWSRRLACDTRGCGQSKAGHCFHLLFFRSFFCFLLFTPSPTSGNLPGVKICFPQYFGITRRYMQKNIFFLVIFIFLRKKTDFRVIFRHYQRSVAEPGTTPSPSSIIIPFLPKKRIIFFNALYTVHL